MSTITNLSTLKINYLTSQQYQNALDAGTINPNELYMTPASGRGSVVTIEPIVLSGTKIATVTIDSIDYDIYSPTPPTKTSDLTNDSNFVSDSNYTHTDNNYTTTEKNKLSNIETGAEVNVIESIKVNNVAQTITSKTVNIVVPTKTSDLTNDSDFVADSSYIHTDNNFTTALKEKLEAISSGAEVNQNAFSNIAIGNTTISADSKTDTLTLEAGDNITLTPNATSDKITIEATDTKYTAATSAPGKVASSSSVGTSTNYARQDHTHGIDLATGDNNGQIKIAGSNVSVKGLGTAAYKNITDTYSATGTDAVSGKAVAEAISNIPEPMVFKGSLGTGGTITELPEASSSNTGFTYKVITAGTYASQSAKVGDMFISDGTNWVIVPSGDEPSGTVTSITIQGTSPILSSSSSAITTSGTRTISHATSGVSEGTYKSVTVDTYGHVTAGTNPTTLAGYGITDATISNGTITLGENTLTPGTSNLTLGESSSTAYRGDRGKTAYDHSQLTSGNPHNVTKSDVGLSNVGNFKAVSTVASQGLTSTEQSNARANIGAGTSNLTIGTSADTAAAGNHTHSAYVNQNAFSNVKVGTTTIAADTTTDTLTLTAGSNVTLTPDATNDSLTIAATDTTYESKTATSGGTAVSLVTTGEKYTWNNKANTGDIPTKVSDLTNDSNFITIDDVPEGTVYAAGTGLSLSGSTFNHSNSVTAKTTQALYPIKIDAQGHISGYGTAVTSLPASDVSAWAKASTKPTYTASEVGAATSNHTHTTNISTSTGTSQLDLLFGGKYQLTTGGTNYIFTLPSIPDIPLYTDVSETGISITAHSTSSIYGVQSSTTTASKASGSNGTAPTLGTAFTVPNVTSAGSASNWVFEDITVPKAAESAIVVPIKNESATSIPNVTAVGSGSFTSGTFSGGSGSFSASVTNHVLSFSHTHTAATHGADTHTHTAPTLGTAISIIGVQSSTTSVTGVGGSTTASHVKSGGNGSAPTLGTAFTIPNVTSAGTASTWSFSNVTVPIKNSSSTTVVTSGTHTVEDSGHTHVLTTEEPS